MSTALIVFAKSPSAGQAKTRLAPALGAEGAAALAAAMLRHATAQAAATGFAHLELCVTPDTAHPVVQALAHAHGLALQAQGEGDLGQRMERALARALGRHPRALLIGSDIPALDAALLQRAAATLDTHDAVFVPTHDGGYALVGLRRPQPALFEGIAWSTPQVMPATRERAAAAGLSWTELAPLHDVDEPADLVHVPPAWLGAAAA